MRRLTSIVAVNRDGVIGCRNTLPWHVKSDLIFFKKTTTGNVVVMGRKTHDSLGKCLPNRYNIVLSKFSLFDDSERCVLRHGIVEGLAEAEACPKDFSEVFVIGGATMYSQFDAFVDRYLITIIDKPIAEGDAFFDMSVLKNNDDWEFRSHRPLSKGDGDEASFEIVELLARRPTERREMRKAAVDALLIDRGKTVSKRRVRSQPGDASLSPVFSWI